MSYEVFIKVEHGDKNSLDLERVALALKLVDPAASASYKTPEGAVAFALRNFADRIDPETDSYGN